MDRTPDHEDLDVYRVSLQFVEDVHNLAKQLPAGNAHLTDQLLRAATSISLNIAEGAGEYSRAEKKRFYRMAKRSASESTAALDVLQNKTGSGSGSGTGTRSAQEDRTS